MTMSRMTASAAVIAACTIGAAPVGAIDLPDGFEAITVVDGLEDPSTMAFAPDGRLFIAERIQGRLRVARRDAKTGAWALNAEPFYVFDIPKNGNGDPERHRSSGLRGFAFDPAFETNGFVYCFYMKNTPRHNRVVRLHASAEDPDRADPEETLLFEVPLTSSGDSSGSHNGGAVIFAADGTLLFTTGDGWNGGDDVQSLSTFTGKLFRLNRDGTIPTDNPFYDVADGAYRAIFALGLRNPFSAARHPVTGEVFINDVNGAGKGVVYLAQAGANYGHDGYGGIGEEQGSWANASIAGSGGEVITGGAWYGGCGPFPRAYQGTYFAALWGRNGSSTGALSRIASREDTSTIVFATNVGEPDPGGDLKPTYTAVGPAGSLYFLATSYEAENAHVYEIRSTAPPDADINGDGVVSIGDLLLILGGWGVCAPEVMCPADVDGDCDVGFADVLILLEQWG